jgi:hypothetical protein
MWALSLWCASAQRATCRPWFKTGLLDLGSCRVHLRLQQGTTVLTTPALRTLISYGLISGRFRGKGHLEPRGGSWQPIQGNLSASDTLKRHGPMLFGCAQRRLRCLPADDQALGGRYESECLSRNDNNEKPNGKAAPSG